VEEAKNEKKCKVNEGRKVKGKEKKGTKGSRAGKENGGEDPN